METKPERSSNRNNNYRKKNKGEMGFGNYFADHQDDLANLSNQAMISRENNSEEMIPKLVTDNLIYPTPSINISPDDVSKDYRDVLTIVRH